MTIGDFCTTIVRAIHYNDEGIKCDMVAANKAHDETLKAMYKLACITDTQWGLTTRMNYEAEIRVAIGLGAMAATGIIGAVYGVSKIVKKAKKDDTPE